MKATKGIPVDEPSNDKPYITRDWFFYNILNTFVDNNEGQEELMQVTFLGGAELSNPTFSISLRDIRDILAGVEKAVVKTKGKGKKRVK